MDTSDIVVCRLAVAAALALVAGMIPVALSIGADSRAPLGRIVTRVVVSTPLALLVVPWLGLVGWAAARRGVRRPPAGRGWAVFFSLRCLAAASLLVVAGCASVVGTVEEAVGLAKRGEVRPLREPLRPIRGTTRVLVVALDGVGAALLDSTLAAGRMPRLAAFLGEEQGGGLREHAVAVPGVVSAFPSETSVGWAAVYTGVGPGRSGVTGNEWFDRATLTKYAPVPRSTPSLENTLGIWADDLFSGVLEVPTLFEQTDVRSHVSMGFVFRGADVIAAPDLDDVGGWLVKAAEAVVDGRQKIYEEIDDDTVRGVERAARADSLPDLQVAYFPGDDLTAHAQGGGAQRAYLGDHYDRHIGDLLDLYRQRGVLGQTYVVVVSDHGHIEVPADDRHSLDIEGRDEPPALLDSLGYRLRSFEPGADTTTDANVVLTYGEPTATLYVADASTCPAPGDRCDWLATPRLEEDVLPLARALRDADAGPLGGVGGLSGTLDLIFVRASDPSGRTSPPFQVLDGDRPVPLADYLRAHPRPDLVDIERRMQWLTDGPGGRHAGDILLLTTMGGGRPVEDRYYFGPPQRSGHGDASAESSTTALVLAREGASGADLRARLAEAIGTSPTQLDVLPLVLSLLRDPAAPADE